MFWIYKLLSPIDDENIYSITQSYLKRLYKYHTENRRKPYSHSACLSDDIIAELET